MAEKWMWRWSDHENPIRVLIENKTDRYVFYQEYNGQGKKFDRLTREEKESNYHRWFDTWKEMHDWMIERAEIKAESLQNQLGVALAELSKVKAMTEPEEHHVGLKLRRVGLWPW